MENQHTIIVTFLVGIWKKIMATLNDTLVEVHDWSRERIHVLCERGEVESISSLNDDAFAIFSEFEEWYDQDVEDHDVFSMEYIGEGSKYD